MITVETLLLVGLGFLIAGLITLALAPTYWSRAVRITDARIRATLPISEAEIQAEHGRLRAQHALTIHDLKSQLDRLQLSASHRRIEVNRRDAQIAELKRRVEQLETALEVNENARLVLEQTITERVPDVERHLREAQRTLEQRDRELSRLKIESAKAYRALQEAIDIGDQQRSEIAQLRERVETRSFRNASGARSADKDSELALRSELEQLRGRTRAQQLTIEELTRRLITLGQSVDSEGFHAAANGDISSSAVAQKPTASQRPDTGDVESSMILELQQQLTDRDTEIAGLQDLVDALEQELAERQGSRFGSLLGQRTTRDARLTDLENKLSAEKSKVRSLQSELAAVNDKLARQAAHFMEELRRLGGRRGTTAGRNVEKSLRPVHAEPRRISLRERIADELVAPGSDKVDPSEELAAKKPDSTAADSEPVRELEAVAEHGATEPAEPKKPRLKLDAGADESSGEETKPKQSSKGGLMARISNLDQAD